MPTEEKSTRKLRTFLVGDVKGYSILMYADEALKMKTIKSYRALMSERIEPHTRILGSTKLHAPLTLISFTPIQSNRFHWCRKQSYYSNILYS